MLWNYLVWDVWVFLCVCVWGGSVSVEVVLIVTLSINTYSIMAVSTFRALRQRRFFVQVLSSDYFMVVIVIIITFTILFQLD
jgi:hypothetical protein